MNQLLGSMLFLLLARAAATIRGCAPSWKPSAIRTG